MSETEINERKIGELEFDDFDKLVSYMEKYMNATYGKACRDTFTYRKDGDKSFGSAYLCFDSQRFPDYNIWLKYNAYSHDIATNYMEIYYQEPITVSMNKLVDNVFDGKCVLFYDGGSWAPNADYDYTCTQEKFEKEHGVSYFVLLENESEWNSEEKLMEIAKNIRKAFLATNIKLKILSFVFVSELPKEKYFDYYAYEKSEKKSIKKCYDFLCKEDGIKCLSETF